MTSTDWVENDDLVMMSAWYFSVMGFYPVCPFSSVLGAPPYHPYLFIYPSPARAQSAGASATRRCTVLKLNGGLVSVTSHGDVLRGVLDLKCRRRNRLVVGIGCRTNAHSLTKWNH